MGAFDLKRALDEATLGPGIQRRIPFQIRRAALERAPVLDDPNILNSPLLQPIFGAGAIPPVFDEADDGLDVIPGGGIPGVSTGTFTGEDIELGQVSAGQPVPPVKKSRAERFRALLGNFLQNWGAGLQAASRAPSGAEFAAGFGGALSAGEERRREQVRIDILRANQARREAQDAESKRRFDLTFAAGEAQREQDRIDEENAANRALQAKLAEIDADEAQSTIQRMINRAKAQTQAQGEERRFRRGIAGQKEILRFQDIIARGKPGKFPQGQRTNLAEAIASRITDIKPSLVPGGGLRSRLQISKIKAKIDKLFRAGLTPDEIAQEFDLAIRGIKGDVTLKGVLDNLADEPVR
jgi:hypothetical protein